MSRRIEIVIDLGFGDSGKGATVDYLAHAAKAPAIVRFNGGPQAGHNVVLPDGRHHTFAQFGSGMFEATARTFLSRFMLIEPYSMLREAEHLLALGAADPMARTMIDGRCTVITPAHQAANRLRERARGNAAHGTCGMGVGEAADDAIRFPHLTLYASELADQAAVRNRLLGFIDHKQRQLKDTAARMPPSAEHDVLYKPNWIESAVDNYAHLARRTRIVSADAFNADLYGEAELIFEGAQGVLLDEAAGFHPYTTWSTTTAANAFTLLREAGITERPRVRGVLRCYGTRHGPGPFVAESSALSRSLPEPQNADDGLQGRFRRGAIDLVALRYAIAVADPIDDLVLTHIDRLAAVPPRPCIGYLWTEPSAERSSFFEMTGDLTATAIRVEQPFILERQAALTEHLLKCRPLFGPPLPTADRQRFVRLLEHELGRPIGLISGGPTRMDKIEKV